MLNSGISGFENSVAPDQLVHAKLADHDPHCCLLLSEECVTKINFLYFSIKTYETVLLSAQNIC